MQKAQLNTHHREGEKATLVLINRQKYPGIYKGSLIVSRSLSPYCRHSPLAFSANACR